MRRTSRGGWLSRLAAKRQKSRVWHPEFEPQNRKPGNSAPFAMRMPGRARGPDMPDTAPHAVFPPWFCTLVLGLNLFAMGLSKTGVAALSPKPVRTPLRSALRLAIFV